MVKQLFLISHGSQLILLVRYLISTANNLRKIFKNFSVVNGKPHMN